MLAETLAATSEVLGGWLAYAGGLAWRVGAPALEPVVRLVSGGTLAVSEPAADAEPASDDRELQARTGDARFRLPATRSVHLVRARVAEPDELARGYGVDCLVLLPRDPWSIFAYWEVAPAARTAALASLGAEGTEAREVLRVYDVTHRTFTGDNAWYAFDVELPAGTQSRYVRIAQPGASYCAELGLRTGSGRFLPLLRSSTVTAARAAPVPDTRVDWVDVG